MDLTLVILAAGMGSRYGGVKQLDGIGPNGEIIMDYSIHDAINAGFTKVVFIIRTDLKEAFENHYKDRFQGKVKMEYAFQDQYTEHTAPYEAHRKKPWGTTHAMLAAKHLIHEPFVVINADDYYGVESFKEAANAIQQMKTTGEYAIVGYQLDKTLSDHGTVNRGVCQVNESMNLLNIKETIGIGRENGMISYEENGQKFTLAPDVYVSMNFWLFTPSVFPEMEKQFIQFVAENREDPKAECYIPVEIDEMKKKGLAQVKVIPTKAGWLGVTYKEDHPYVVAGIQTMIEEGTYPTKID